MSTTDADRLDGYDESAATPEPPTTAPAPGSLRDRLGAQRRKLEVTKDVVVPVSIYPGLHVRYRILSYEALRRITSVNEGDMESPQGELNIAADTLIHACMELLDEQPDGTLVATGYRWGARAARELFEITDLPDDATERDGVLRVFAGEAGGVNLVVHAGMYNEKISGETPGIDELMRGESAAGSAATSSGSR